jgi:hypothetical protein
MHGGQQGLRHGRACQWFRSQDRITAVAAAEVSRRGPSLPRMTRQIRFVLFLLAVGVLGVLLGRPQPHAEEMETSDPQQVTEDEIELYIRVYSAMQDDHDLTIENAIRPYQMSLDSFRHLERRIQNQTRLVDRVRQALLEHARASSVFAQTLGTPTPASTPVAEEPPGEMTE